ncbi:PAS domain S-box protein [Halobacterium yunchengense]|uniref:PAS domain S-box protein n=1 Tax=Halobacterium yunchengense TaxID=3108497 RepID=UPI0030097CAF
MTRTGDRRTELLSYAETVAKATDVETVREELAAAAASALDCPSAAVATETDGALSVRAGRGHAPALDELAADGGVAARASQRGESVLVEDSREDARVPDSPEGAPLAVLSVPVGDAGVLLAADDPGGLDGDDLAVAELLASHAARAAERVRSEGDLRESERRFRKLFEQADDALVLYDVAAGGTEIRFANDAAEALFDAPESALRGESLAAFFDVDAERFAPGDDDASFEARLAADDDRVFEFRVKPFLRDGGPDAFAIVSDVTDRHHREHSLTALHDATRRMLVAEDDERIAAVAVEAADDLLGLPFVGVFYADDDDRALRPAAVSDPVEGDEPPVLRAGESLAWGAYETGEVQSYGDVREESTVHNPETRIRAEIIHPLGSHGVLLVGATEPHYFTRTDRDLLRVLATNTEAALDRAGHVRQLRRRESELRRERNRLGALFENVPSPTASFVVEDGDPIVRSVNPAFERVFGYSEDELAGENIDDYIVPPDREREAGVYNRKLVAGQNVNVEVRRLTDDGPRDFLLDVVPFRLDEPNVHGYAVYTDITERKERERELRRQNDRLEEFASIVSHDLRNPLNVARGYLELAEQTGDDEYFRRMDEALDRMHDIIESVLSLARHGRSLDDARDIALADAAERAWRTVDTGDATLDVADDVTVTADESRFGSLLENLFRNAVEHGSPSPDSQARRGATGYGGADVTVTVGALEDGDGFYVADDGPGIPEGEREAVFEYGESRNEEGTGFGLAIVHSVAEAHGWTAELTDSDAGGARFEFRTGD